MVFRNRVFPPVLVDRRELMAQSVVEEIENSGLASHHLLAAAAASIDWSGCDAAKGDEAIAACSHLTYYSIGSIMIPAIQRDRSDSDRHFNAAYHFRHRALDLTH